MELRPTARALRTIDDLMHQQTQRAQRQQDAVNQGLEHFVRTEEAKTKIAIRSITAGAGELRAQA